MATQQISRRREALLLILPLLVIGFLAGTVLIGLQSYDNTLAMIGFCSTTAILAGLYIAVRNLEGAINPASFVAIFVTTVAILGRVYEVNFGAFRAESAIHSLTIAIYFYVPVLFLFGFMLLSRRLALTYAIACWLAVLLMALVSNLSSFPKDVWPEGLNHLVSVVCVGYPMFIVLIHKALPFADVVTVAKAETEMVRDELVDMEKLVLVDKLTGIYNRRFLANFWENFAGENSYNAQYLSLFMIDIDFFKKFNDSAGHIEGDACLKTVATELSGFAHDFGGHAVRFGGEEFLVLIPSETQLDTVGIAEQIRSSIQNLRISHPDPTVSSLSVSVGATDGTRSSNTSESDWMRAADAALYDAKGAGRNCSVVRILHEI